MTVRAESGLQRKHREQVHPDDGNVSHPGPFANDHWSIGVLIAGSD